MRSAKGQGARIVSGDRVLVKAGSHAGKVGTVVKVSAGVRLRGRDSQGRADALCSVKFEDGRTEYCIMRNLEKVKESADDESLRSAKKGGGK